MNAEINNDLPSNNPEDLHKIFEQIQSGQDIDLSGMNPDETNNDAKQQAAEIENKDSEEQAKQKIEQDQDSEQQEADGVATKDGKHVIPFSVLKSERDRAARAEQSLNESQQRIAALEAKLKLNELNNQGANTGENARATDQNQSDEPLDDEIAEALNEDFPTVHKALQAEKAKRLQLEAEIQEIKESFLSEKEAKARAIVDEVQDAIDSIPKLAHIQATDQEAFELAKQMDAVLKEQPFWQDKSYKERFAKVVDMVENTMGKTIDVPGNKTNSMSAEEMAKAARAKAAKAAVGNGSNVPVSLSEFPAGRHVAEDEQSSIEQMTHLQLSEKFSRMSPEEMDTYFRSL